MVCCVEQIRWEGEEENRFDPAGGDKRETQTARSTNGQKEYTVRQLRVRGMTNSEEKIRGICRLNGEKVSPACSS